MRKVIAFTLASVAVVAAAAPAAAQDPGSRQTREFVQASGESDQFEILEGRTVLAQSTDPQVRAFAQRMIQDHGQTSQMLRDATARSGLRPPPEGLGGDQARLLNELQSLRGKQFDQAYARHQVLAHHSALVVEQQYAAGGDDPALRRVASSATTVITSHLAMAEQMQARLGGS